MKRNWDKFGLLILLVLLVALILVFYIKQLQVNEYKTKYNMLLEEYNKIKEDFKKFGVIDISDHAFCGDNICKGYYIELENYEVCPTDCYCGDGVCDEVEEAFQTCQKDCT